MTLPEVCPRDGTSQCRKADCHLYVIDWRSGDEQCLIGYSSTHKQMSRSSPVVDTYAERTRLERERKREHAKRDETFTKSSIDAERSAALSSVFRPSDVRVQETGHSASGQAQPGVSGTQSPSARDSSQREVQKKLFHETVVSSDKNTTLIESGTTPEEGQTSRKKRKSIDDVMDLDLPENYEEEFWK